MINGYILKQLSEQEVRDGYLPTVEFVGYSFFEHSGLDIALTLPELPTDGQFDELRLALSQWAKRCGFGELAEES